MANDENLKKGVDTQFRTGEEAARAGRKGGVASGVARRKKAESRKFLKMLLASEPKRTANIIKALEALGMDPNTPLKVEDLGVIQLVKKYCSGDLRAYDMVHEYLGEDPHTMMEEKRLKAQKEAVKAITNSDGFMSAMAGAVEEVFDDGGDTPDTLEDTE